MYYFVTAGAKAGSKDHVAASPPLHYGQKIELSSLT